MKRLSIVRCGCGAVEVRRVQNLRKHRENLHCANCYKACLNNANYCGVFDPKRVERELSWLYTPEWAARHRTREHTLKHQRARRICRA